MKRGLSPATATCLLALSAIVSSATSQAESIHGQVVRVWDGDTVTLKQSSGAEHRIRLAGIDAPEHDQPFGPEAAAKLTQLVLNKAVTVETEKTDKYGRKLGKIWVQPIDCPSCGKTLDANLAMLTVGLAWWYRYYRKDQSAEDQGRYEFAEFEARAKGAGLWQQADPTAPWDWPRGPDKGKEGVNGCPIKGNISNNGRIYHLPGQRYYDQTKISATRGERWFCSEKEAQAAGWRRSRS